MSASTAYRPVHAGYPGMPHVHVYDVAIIRRSPTAPFFEMVEGWRCECGARRPPIRFTMSPEDHVSAAMRYIAARYGAAAKAWTRYGGGDA